MTCHCLLTIDIKINWWIKRWVAGGCVRLLHATTNGGCADVRMCGCGCRWWSDHTPLSALLLFNRSTRDVIQWNLTARKFYLWIQFFSSMIHSSIGLLNYRLTISIDKFRHLKYRLPSAELLESNEILLVVNWLISTIDMKNIDYYLLMSDLSFLKNSNDVLKIIDW